MAGIDLGPVDGSSNIRHLQGEDPTAYVLSANVHRRKLSTGQRAMAIAMLRPEPEKGGRGKKGAVSGEFSGVPHQRVSEARDVIAYSREIAEAVMRGETPLQAALKEARHSQGGVPAWGRRGARQLICHQVIRPLMPA